MKCSSIIFLLCCISFVAQAQDRSGEVKDRLNAMLKNNLIADLSISYNQPVYVAGDTVFFVLRSAKLKKQEVAFREMVTLYVFSSSNEKVLEHKLILKNGTVASQFILPPSLSAGDVQVKIVCDRFRIMDNFAFTDYLTVVESKESNIHPGLRFFAESGNLVSGIKNRVSFQSKRHRGQQVSVVDHTGAVLGNSLIDSLGNAVMEITPEASRHYTARILNLEGKLVSEQTLPNPALQGVIIKHLNDESREKIRVVSTTGKHYYLAWVTEHKVVSVVGLEGDDVTVEVPSAIQQPIGALIIDDEFNISARRWLITKQIDMPVWELSSTYDKTVKTRQAVSASFKIDQEAVSSISVRVIKKDLFQNEGLHSLRQKSSDLIFYQDFIFPNKLLPENSIPTKPVRQSLKGRLILLDQNASLKDSVVLVFFLKQRILGYEVLVSDDGNFNLPLAFDVQGDETIFFTAQSRSGDLTNLKIQWQGENIPNAELKPVSTLVGSPKIDPYGFYASRKQLITQSYYQSVSAIKKDNPNALYEEELGGVDIVREIADYNPFPNMTELVREILPAVEARVKGGKTIIRVYTSHKRPKDNFQPLIIIDGNFYKEPGALMGLSPNDIVTIKIVKDIRKLRNFGRIADNGIIMVVTKSRQTRPSLNQFIIHGVAVKQNSIAYRGNWTAPQRTPDLRPCLLWMPEATAENGALQLKFNAADDLGKYLIQVDGQTQEGEAFMKEVEFEVVR